MQGEIIIQEIKRLEREIEGELFRDESSITIYSTDASAYKERPIGIVRPKTKDDLLKIISFAGKNNVPIIPRTAGTSLAGQVVGNGLIVDVSKHFNKIIEINKAKKWVRVEPGVVLDELNMHLKPHGLFFGPETSTSSRCMIGGMVGNNSCGSHSLVYGSTRDHTLSVNAILSDGSEVVFGPLSLDEFNNKCEGSTLENKLYRNIRDMLSDSELADEIEKEYPDKQIHRRNTGYALDILMDSEPFGRSPRKFNFCSLLAGSEGTLAFITEITLNLVDLPPKAKGLVCVHFSELNKAFHGNLIALKHRPAAVELMDRVIIECTEGNIEQKKNRFFLKGTPEAVLVVEFVRETIEEVQKAAQELEEEMRHAGLGYHFPLVTGNDINRIWALRKAGLGLLSNVPGDAKPVAVIEDTAINVHFLPEYMEEFQSLLKNFGLSCVYYAHIGTGELHLRPVLNLKKERDVELFHSLALEVAKLVKAYNGSLSGEHGDGRLRGEFIPLMYGERIYNKFKEIKSVWDPQNIFNPGKITDTPKMNTFLRFQPGQHTPEPDTYFDFSSTEGILRAIEKCNGSADCRKSELIGGTMCPSFMATREESATTRARANMLREVLTNSTKKNPFDSKELYRILDLCLMCKGCKSECPSSVDMARLKSEFLQHYYNSHRPSVRSNAVANIHKANRILSLFPAVSNFLLRNNAASFITKILLGFSTKRKLPGLYNTTLRAWYKKHLKELAPKTGMKGSVYLFVDEFTEYNDTEIGIKAIQLLSKLGYKVYLPQHKVSGRTYISKGFLKKAKEIANQNVSLLCDTVSADSPLLGIEPSGILTFRDEYPDLVDKYLKEDAISLSKNCMMIDEFLAREMKNGKIGKDFFSPEYKDIKVHGHCHQKTLASVAPTLEMLSFPRNYNVQEIKSGCCGMSGSFGYEKEHYALSMKVGELILFPEIRNSEKDICIAAPGTSCRHHIKDGTGKTAYHPIEILYDALL